VLDGATGTMLQSKQPTVEDFGGEALDGCNEALNLFRPDVVVDMHRAYLEAGADIIETNTFGGTPIVLAEYGLEDRTVEINQTAAELARQAVDACSEAGQMRFVAGSVGPTTKAISVTGGTTFGGLVDAYRTQVRGLIAGGVDLLMVETCQDTRNAKAALIAVENECEAAEVKVPVLLSGTIEPMGTMLAGQTAEAFVASTEHAGLFAIGLNCATGPEFMTDHIRTVHEMASCAVACYPNAGLPDEDGNYEEGPEQLAAALERFVTNGWVNIIGGCCGTDDKHVAAIARMVEGKRPREIPGGRLQRTYFSGLELIEARDENRPLLVGERTNVIGSKKFRLLVADGNFDEASEIGRRQVQNGAQIVDVCLQTADRNELDDIDGFYDQLTRKIKVPIMIDSTDPSAVERALTFCQGKAIVNSINLEDGEDRFAQVCPLLRRYGAAVVVGAIDEEPEQAQALTRERKLEIAERSYELLTERYGVPETDIIFDPLTFPTATGDVAYIGSAVETIEGLRLIKKRFPRCKTVLGISNVSFGLPIAAREVVNSVFLYHCTKAGLDLAIVNTQRLERYASIQDGDRSLDEHLLLNRPCLDGDLEPAVIEQVKSAPEDWRLQTAEQRELINRLNIARITEWFRGVKKKTQTIERVEPEQLLGKAVIEGTRDGLEEALTTMLDRGHEPLEIINGPLMSGMAEVGRLFNANQLIVAEVLQSAESMKAAVAYLEQFMEAGTGAGRGKVILATVKGDVHDIGKNLVDIILRNNGFDVRDLGIKVAPETLLNAVREFEPDAIGLSGLLVKSAQQMVVTAQDLSSAGIKVPILVGGAALSEKFTRSRIAPTYKGAVVYCQDAMLGLKTMLDVVSPEGIGERCGDPSPAEESHSRNVQSKEAIPSTQRSSLICLDVDPVPAPVEETRVMDRIDQLREVWSYINPQMLFGKHLGFRGNFARKLAERDTKAMELHSMMEEVQSEAESWLRVAAVWRFLEAEASGNQISVFEPGAPRALHSFEFPRQHRLDGLCLADYVVPAKNGVRDSLGAFVVTAGEGVRQRALQAKDVGEYLKSHAIQALAIETAEAAAEWLHRRFRELWGFPDPPDTSMKDRFSARYRGTRFSFGYPACPDLDDQAGLWKLLNPDQIGVELTDGMMMDPEASVSALVFHHPDSRYFSVGKIDS
jgi:5-methyltetrahydrofolate--homocysteine methyltransferase